MVPVQIGMLATLGLFLVVIGGALLAWGRRAPQSGVLVLRRLGDLPDGDPWKELGSHQALASTSRQLDRDLSE